MLTSIPPHVFSNCIINRIFVLNEFTAPAYFMSLMCILNLILISIFFQDRKRIRKDTKRKSSRQQSVDDFANKTTSIGITVYDACILGCMLLNVATKGSIASFETLGIAFAQSHFDMYSSTAGSVVGTCGTVGVIALLSMGKLAKVLTDVQMIVGGMLVMVIGVLSLMGLPHGGETSPSWRYWIGMFLIYSVGYPIGHTAVIGLFSKSELARLRCILCGDCYSYKYDLIFAQNMLHCNLRCVLYFFFTQLLEGGLREPSSVGLHPQVRQQGWYSRLCPVM